MQLKIEDDSGLVLWMGLDELVQVPLARDERARCRAVLTDALALMDETITLHGTLATEVGEGQFVKRNSPHLSDCLGVYDFSPP